MKKFFAYEKALQPITDAVNEKLQEFINDGCKCYAGDKEVVISVEETTRLHEGLKRELIEIVKNYIPKVQEVSRLIYNNNRGFDCYVIGMEGEHISINTILAGGYNIYKDYIIEL